MVEVFRKQHLDTARFFALSSECVRRKYGAIIIDDFGNSVALGTNRRFGKYCSSTLCIRDYCKVPHGERVELGGEIHAEQAALVDWIKNPLQIYHILVTGWNHDGKLLDGIENYPCHVCAMMIKYAGFPTVWFPFGNEILPVSIDEILEFYER